MIMSLKFGRIMIGIKTKRFFGKNISRLFMVIIWVRGYGGDCIVENKVIGDLLWLFFLFSCYNFSSKIYCVIFFFIYEECIKLFFLIDIGEGILG